jgi:hypothetical protein
MPVCCECYVLSGRGLMDLSTGVLKSMVYIAECDFKPEQ